MTHSTLKTAAFGLFLAIAALAPILSGTPAEARGGKDYYSQTYTFDRPMNGFEGRQGNYYCSYVKTPKQVCNAQGKCKKVWELEQHCY